MGLPHLRPVSFLAYLPVGVVERVGIEHAGESGVLQVVGQPGNDRLVAGKLQQHFVIFQIDDIAHVGIANHIRHGPRRQHGVGTKALHRPAVVDHGLPVLRVKIDQLARILPEAPGLHPVEDIHAASRV